MLRKPVFCLRRLIAAALLAVVATAAIAQPYPTRPVRLMVSFPPGGASDVIARLIAQPLAARLGQPLAIPPDVSLDHALDRESFGDIGLAGRGEPSTQWDVVVEAPDGGGKLVRLARADQEPCLSISDDFRNSANPSGHNRAPDHERFNEHLSERLCQCRMCE